MCDERMQCPAVPGVWRACDGMRVGLAGIRRRRDGRAGGNECGVRRIWGYARGGTGVGVRQGVRRRLSRGPHGMGDTAMLACHPHGRASRRHTSASRAVRGRQADPERFKNPRVLSRGERSRGVMSAQRTMRHDARDAAPAARTDVPLALNCACLVGYSAQD